MTLRITTYYRAYLDYFYKRNPKFASYMGMYSGIMRDGFQAEIGDHTIIANDKWLQLAWLIDAKEGLAWGRGLLLKQVKAYNPECVIIQNLYRYNGGFVNKIKELGVKKVIGYICSELPKGYEKKFEPFDLILTCNNIYYKELQSKGIKSKIVKHGFNEDNLSRTIRQTAY